MFIPIHSQILIYEYVKRENHGGNVRQSASEGEGAQLIRKIQAWLAHPSDKNGHRQFVILTINQTNMQVIFNVYIHSFKE
jgi:hypothetical protein